MGSVFQDSEVKPSDEMIRAALGSKPEAWNLVITLLTDAGTVLSWRYYRDGGWLAKATLGKKTIAWLAVEDGFVRVTFYFAERHRTTLRNLPDLPRPTGERIAAMPLSGKLLPVTFEIHTPEDADTARLILEAKLTAK